MNRAFTSFTYLTTSVNKNFSLVFTYIQATNRLVRLAVLTTLLPLFFNISLSSCTQADTISPESESHSSAREDASVLYTDGFENNQIANFWRTELRTPTAGLITSDKKRAGKQAMRFSWKSSQVNGTNDMLHSELAMGNTPIGETERWYGYSSYMPSSSMANEDQTVIVSQWHGHPDAGFEDSIPPLCIEIKSNDMQLVYSASNKPIIKPLQSPTSMKRIDLGAAIFDRWVDYVVHVKWDPIGKTGQLQVWQDGVLLVNEQAISIGYIQNHKPFWKIGLYCWTGKSIYDEKVMYYDEARVGGPSANYDAVKPGRNDNSAKDQR
ncbi:hypothetical protein G8759_30655 [Spirosoma aureum]|uniref:Polysaccharide lyase family 7 protein n=1 Tax=Spirosoma aureum TaxID=2692134 RepID=A0A6G9AWF0_9BACT|nr:polysaccharide lyase [Spirosoma aureum]QIP16694.1 hypothetical protein G8759_30655 [Spirosoma aureum]